MNVKSIVAEYLKENKYDGLCCLDVPCGCLLEDLAPCGEMSEKCRPGHRENVDKHTPCDCDESGEDHWHIVAHGDFGVMCEEDANGKKACGAQRWSVLCLARTDTAWWHDYAMKGQIRFLRGRLKFGNAKHSAPFPSAVVVFPANTSNEAR